MLLLAGLLLSVFVLAGCSPRRSPTSVELNRESGVAYDDLAGQQVAASALVFDAPIAFDEEPIFLSRSDRQPAAFFGYDEGSIEYYRLTVDDQQLGLGGGSWGSRGGYGGGSSGWYDRYDRRAYSDRIGTIRR